MDDTQIEDEIGQLKAKLDTYNEISSDYLPSILIRLRNYIFQVHTVYEKSMYTLVGQHYIKRSISSDESEMLFACITYADKLKLTMQFDINFPAESAKKIGSLRNEFAHKSGAKIRERYNLKIEIHKKLHSLSKFQDDIDTYWLATSGMGFEAARKHVDLNNKRFLRNQS